MAPQRPEITLYKEPLEKEVEKILDSQLLPGHKRDAILDLFKRERRLAVEEHKEALREGCYELRLPAIAHAYRDELED